MCRLYGFCATEPTKVECTLVHAQNALITQSEQDLSGKSHSHGWGVATYEVDVPHLERQAWAAYHGEHFKRAAAKVYSKTVVAHVRRATVGGPAIENTHPFVSGDWTFAHNGTVPNFKMIKAPLLERTTPRFRAAIEGQTDSEHVFAYVMTLMEKHGSEDLSDILRRTAATIESLVRAAATKKKLGLNIMLTNGDVIAGTRIGRTLHYIEREGVYDCEICGFPHIHHDPKAIYWASVIASEPITHEDWREMPNRSVWIADPKRQSLQIDLLD